MSAKARPRASIKALICVSQPRRITLPAVELFGRSASRWVVAQAQPFSVISSQSSRPRFSLAISPALKSASRSDFFTSGLIFFWVLAPPVFASSAHKTKVCILVRTTSYLQMSRDSHNAHQVANIVGGFLFECRARPPLEVRGRGFHFH